jgi:predicted HicB family RNase H-like nuclease
MSLLPAFNLRLPAELRALLELAAKANTHSLNQEIVHRLRRSFETDYRR